MKQVWTLAFILPAGRTLTRPAVPAARGTLSVAVAPDGTVFVMR